jgi:hypothetical protein
MKTNGTVIPNPQLDADDPADSFTFDGTASVKNKIQSGEKSTRSKTEDITDFGMVFLSQWNRCMVLFYSIRLK